MRGALNNLNQQRITAKIAFGSHDNISQRLMQDQTAVVSTGGPNTLNKDDGSRGREQVNADESLGRDSSYRFQAKGAVLSEFQQSLTTGQNIGVIGDQVVIQNKNQKMSQSYTSGP